jgi:adenine phosphoribosyltransferase
MTDDGAMDLRRFVRDVPDYPKPGIIFKDITPLLGSAPAFRSACDAMAKSFDGDGVTHVAAIESRGFFFGAPIAMTLQAALVPLRKRGKLPYDAEFEEYELEYGTDALEMHIDAITPRARVLVVDDVLATGGTAAAACRLIERMKGAVVGCAFLIELGFLNGSKKLHDRRVTSLITYEDEG